MIFAALPLDQAEGAILGHSVTVGPLRLKKGHVLSAADLDHFRTAGRASVVAARLEAGDIPEDQAASRVANAAAGIGIKAQAAFTGRCNLYADAHGLVMFDRARLERLNGIDESVTIATLEPFAMVHPGDMIATIKIIPFAAPVSAVEACAAIAAADEPLIRVAAFTPHKAGLVVTALPETKRSVLDKTVAVTAERLKALGSVLLAHYECPHEEAAIADSIGKLVAQGADPILICGASAIVDRRDMAPAGLVRAGGEIDYFGMPVDPGNLLLVGHHGKIPVVCLPGCARSLKLNGFDFVLRRILAELPTTRADIAAMGAGGLLKEIASRPLPREAAGPIRAEPPRVPKIAALILAAGQSRRMGSNKLMAPVDGKPMLRHAVDAALQSSARPVIVVTGHQPERVSEAVAGMPVQLVHNPSYADGLSTSLRAGIESLPPDVDGVLICLGDMPNIEAEQIEKLLAAFNPVEGRAIIVPTYSGKRGNPVVWAASLFPEMKVIAGDVGARHLIGEHQDLVREVPMPDPAVLTDIDTPEALAALHASHAK
jgi:molybdenum cofactor cytidylyltransferase